MSKKNKNKKAHEKFKAWLIGFLTDLVVGIILILISRLF